MDIFTKEDLYEAKRAILSTISKCEKAEISMANHQSQLTLLKRRIKALKIAITLIEREIEKE